MDIDGRQILLSKELSVNIVELIKKIEDKKNNDLYKKSYIKILRNIENNLSKQPLDLDKLSKDEFGIFRLVTDGPADSPIEQELMALVKKLYHFRQEIKKLM